MQAEEVAEVAEAASIDYESYSSSLTEAIDGMLTEAGENPSAISRDFIFNLSSALAVSINEIKLVQIPYEFHEAGDLTGVESVELGIKNKDDRSIYDLQGRKINGKPVQGIYIQNGSKIKK